MLLIRQTYFYWKRMNFCFKKNCYCYVKKLATVCWKKTDAAAGKVCKCCCQGWTDLSLRLLLWLSLAATSRNVALIKKNWCWTAAGEVQYCCHALQRSRRERAGVKNKSKLLLLRSSCCQKGPDTEADCF